MTSSVEQVTIVHPPPLHTGARACEPRRFHRPSSDSVSAEMRGPRRPGTSVLVVDDSKLHRENLAAAIMAGGSAMPSLAWDLPSLHAALDDSSPTIILLNVATRDNLTLLHLARERRPEAMVIAVGVEEEDEDEIIACAEGGVAGYHLRSDSLADLFDVIQQVNRGEFVCSPKVSAILLRRVSTLAAQSKPVARRGTLTNREVEILRMLEMGLSNRDIARQLSIAVHTVKNHVHSVLRKLGVSTRHQAAALSRDLA